MFVKISNLKMPIDAPLPEVLEAAEGLCIFREASCDQ